MKVAVAFAGLMASSVMAEVTSLTQLIVSDDNVCSTVAGGDLWSNSETDWTKINIDEFKVVDDHILVHAYHYFPAATGDNLETPATAYDDASLFENDATFKTRLNLAANEDTDQGRTLFLRIDYAVDAETSCTTEKTAGTTQFRFNHEWSPCADETCAAVTTDTTGWNIFTRSDNTIADLIQSNTWTFDITDGSVPDDYAIMFDGGVDADAADPKPCATDTNTISAALGGFTAGSGSQPMIVSTAESMRNSNIKSDGTTETDFKFSPVFKQMCGDSTRVAQVAALSAASVAAGLLSFF